MAALIAVAGLALPVSTISSIIGLEPDGLALVLSADGYWLALGLVALLCAPQRAWRSSTSTAATTASTPAEGDA